MAEPIRDLRVSGFRALTDLTIGPFGRVNLITGRNNAGKSSLLEAIRILATDGSPRTFYDILNYREESESKSTPEGERSYLPTDFSPYSGLFSGYPNLGQSDKGFTISTSGERANVARSLSVRIGWFIEKVDADRRSVSYESAQSDLFGETEGFPALEIESPERKRVIPVSRVTTRLNPRIRALAEVSEGGLGPCLFLDPFSSRSTSQLAALWDTIALTDTEKEVVGALRIISSDIEAVSMIGSTESSSRPRTAIARSSHYSTPVPLRTFGDGVNRLFGIILSLCSARTGILLVDEIENGLHHSVLTDIWRAIFRLSRDLDVQVFATSHSWDCVESFQRAAVESPEDGTLVRLTLKGEQIVPTVFNEQELGVATRHQIELR